MAGPPADLSIEEVLDGIFHGQRLSAGLPQECLECRPFPAYDRLGTNWFSGCQDWYSNRSLEKHEVPTLSVWICQVSPLAVFGPLGDSEQNQGRVRADDTMVAMMAGRLSLPRTPSPWSTSFASSYEASAR